MTTRLHHIHAAVVHAPLTLIPAAALMDLRAVTTSNRVQARIQAQIGRKLWWYAVGSAAVAGVAGMAASQEVKTDARPSQATMWLHGTTNVALLLGTIAMASWRQRRKPTAMQSIVGLGSVAVMGYASWLGGMLVYEQGTGVSAMPERANQGVGRSPRLLSPQAPLSFLRDAARGAWWLLSRARTMLRDRQSLGRAAVGQTERRSPEATAPREPTQQQYDWRP
jgi:uncharacterized membrane protein